MLKSFIYKEVIDIFWNLTYKEQADKNKEKIIKRDVKIFKKKCISELNNNVIKGIDFAVVDFFGTLSTYPFENEILDRSLKELKEEYPNVEFSFSYRHYQNSYKGIQMVAI